MKKLEEKIYEALKEKGYKVATAESCTGGLLAGKIINVAGASEILDMSFVTYSNEAKNQLVEVNLDTIEKYGVVSEQVAAEMALGASQKANCQVGLSTTGVAGPGGGTKSTPVGMVCFGIAINGNITTYTMCFEPKSRDYVRKQSVKFSLTKLLELLKN